MDDSFLLFAIAGFVAQIMDGALGMCYGVVFSTALISFGVTLASAAVHATEVVPSATSAGCHAWRCSVNWPLFWTLARGHPWGSGDL